MSLPLILSVETATLSGSVAVARGQEILGVVSGDSSISHSNTLLGDVDQLLTQTGITLPEIDLFAVATGPGSFTGLRIGIATIKALAATLDRPTAGIPTLAAVALSGGVSAESVALLPAGRGEVFTQLFSVLRPDFVEALEKLGQERDDWSAQFFHDTTLDFGSAAVGLRADADLNLLEPSP